MPHEKVPTCFRVFSPPRKGAGESTEQINSNNMKNIPRIFIDSPLSVGQSVALGTDTIHYLQRVMRTNSFLAFNGDVEFYATIDGKNAKIGENTGRADPSNDITLAFAPIKQSRLEEMLNAATQMGVARLQPVITEHTTAQYINWSRIQKIIIEASEQSNRNSVPELLPPKSFSNFLAAKDQEQGSGIQLVFADERFAHNSNREAIHPRRTEKAQVTPSARAGVLASPTKTALCPMPYTLLIGPEGGFSNSEFAALDANGAIGISLGATILRSETAAVVGLALLKVQM